MNIDDVREAIFAVVQYNWADELRDFKEQHDEDEPQALHIFHSLVLLDNFLTGGNRRAEDYIG